jgi:Zn-dependent metalloprotease
LALLEEGTEPIKRTLRVAYAQTFRGVPIHGARVGVEMRSDQSLIGVDGTLATLGDVSVNPGLTAEAATAALRTRLGDTVTGPIDPPELKLRFVGGKWTLAWVFADVFITGAAPDDGRDSGANARPFEVYIDANRGTELVRIPTSAHVRVQGSGTDRSGRTHVFGVDQVAPDTFELHDPTEGVRTCTLGFRTYSSANALPGLVVRSSGATFDAPTAIAAHAHAGRVLDYFRRVFVRDGIDGKGLGVVSAVDCIEAAGVTVWRNAAWVRWRSTAFPAEVRRGMMIYGQIKRQGDFFSIAEGLDVVGHELTHGITDYTAGLEYREESGALNESFSDIFGLFIANEGKAVADWDWTIGRVLDAAGEPLRDLRNPGARGQPDHLSKQRRLPGGTEPDATNDQGWVHFNSGIPNRAAYNVISSPLFTVEEAAQLFYLTLTTPGRLPPTASFRDVRAGMIASCEYLFDGEPDLPSRVAAVEAAYAGVGII